MSVKKKSCKILKIVPPVINMHQNAFVKYYSYVATKFLNFFDVGSREAETFLFKRKRNLEIA